MQGLGRRDHRCGRVDRAFGQSSGRLVAAYGLESAQLSATADADASVTATVQGKGSCELKPIQIAQIKGPGDTFFIGPIPVVLTSQLLIDLNAGASVGAKLTAGIAGGYHATAGIAWKRGDGFQPVNDFGPSFRYTPPTLTANADVDASIDPTVQVSLDGGGHANLNLSAGLALSADTTKNPWWDLTAPVSVTGDLDISKLGLSSPTLTIYKHDFDLLHANGPFSTSPTGPPATPAPAPTPPSGTGPYAHATPLTATTGPAGYAITVGTPVCSANRVDMSIDGGSPSWDTADTEFPYVFVLTTPLSVGVHHVSFTCEYTNGGTPVWSDPGFAFDVNAPPTPTVLQTYTVARGGSITFRTGASNGPSPCPILNGVAADQLDVWLEDSQSHPMTQVSSSALPDGATSETLLVPPDLSPGTYQTQEQCIYGTGVTSQSFLFQTASVSVT
jgi:hypothetical protein